MWSTKVVFERSSTSVQNPSGDKLVKFWSSLGVNVSGCKYMFMPFLDDLGYLGKKLTFCKQGPNFEIFIFNATCELGMAFQPTS